MTKPTIILNVGMAGSGKTTLMQRLNADLHIKNKTPFIINLDPAVINLPFDTNIDIRDTIDYKGIMKDYSLGPNGAILCALNLFAARFDLVLEAIEEAIKSEEYDYILIDTPGQIEIFTWSASGSIIMESLSSLYPTILTYIADTPRSSEGPATFMSNMLYACSILYKSKLPLVLVFNKCDQTSSDRCLRWMKDSIEFQEDMIEERHRNPSSGGTGDYMDSMVQSMSLVLDTFYENLPCASVSSITGCDIDDLYVAIGEARIEYENTYLPIILKRQEKRKEEQASLMEKMMTKLSLQKSDGKGGDGKERDAKEEF